MFTFSVNVYTNIYFFKDKQFGQAENVHVDNLDI